MGIASERINEILRQNGMRVTAHAKSVLAVLGRFSKPLTVRDILGALPGKPCDPATIHRILGKCERAGLVRGANLTGRSRRFELAIVGSHHHHLICTHCDRVEPLSVCEVGRVEKRVRKEAGFRVTSHALELFGICRDCGKRNKDQRAEARAERRPR